MLELSSVAGILLQHHHNRIADNEAILLKALVACLCWRETEATLPTTMPSSCPLPSVEGEKGLENPSSVVRLKARKIAGKLVHGMGGDKIAIEIMKAFAQYLDCSKIEVSNWHRGANERVLGVPPCHCLQGFEKLESQCFVYVQLVMKKKWSCVFYYYFFIFYFFAKKESF